MLTRRRLIQTAAASAGALTLPLPLRAQGLAEDLYETAAGPVSVVPVAHASLILKTPAGVIYADPVGGPELYAGQPAPDLILVTHEHGDHFDLPTLEALAKGAQLIVNPAVMEKLSGPLEQNAIALANGANAQVDAISVEAVPAYNTTPDRLQYHPQGRDNGYVLTIAEGPRIYVAGDTEDTPELRAQTDILIAFVPMNLPYTMTVGQAADGVNAFQPRYVYPYHYRGQDPQAFAALVKGPEVRMGAWYPPEGG